MLRKRVQCSIGIALAFVMTLQLLPVGFLSDLLPTAHATDIENIDTGYTFDVPEDSPYVLERNAPPTFIISPEVKEQQDRSSETESSVPSRDNAVKVPDPIHTELDEDDYRYLSIFSSNSTYSSLSDSDKSFVCSYTMIPKDLFLDESVLAMPINQAASYCSIANKSGWDLSAVVQLLPDTDAIRSVTIQLEIYLLATQDSIRGTDLDHMLIGYLLQGYTYKQVIQAYAISKALNIETGDILTSCDAVSEDDLVTESSSLRMLEPSIVSAALRSNISEPDLDAHASEIETIIRSITRSGSTRNEFDDEVEISTNPSLVEAPFLYASGDHEKVSLNTGALVYETTDYVLPGVNGLDLVIGRRYNSQNSSVHIPQLEYRYESFYNVYYGVTAYLVTQSGEMEYYPEGDTDWDFESFNTESAAIAFCNNWISRSYYQEVGMPGYSYIYYDYYASVSDQLEHYEPYTNRVKYNYEEKLYGLGQGWSFTFSSIENANTDDKVLHLANGETYELGDWNGTCFPLINYSLSDLTLTTHNANVLNTGIFAKFKLVYQDGRIEYFDSAGRLVVIQDRYNNRITFEYSLNNAFYDVVITDTLDRVVELTQTGIAGGHYLVFSLPDGTNLQYNVTYGSNNEKQVSSFVDQQSRTTSYSYSIDSIGFCLESKSSGYTKYSTVSNLTCITHPTNAQTSFTYSSSDTNVGGSGILQRYRVASRQDKIGTTVKNKLNYTYSANDYSGYPQYTRPDRLDENYRYSTTVSRTSGLSTVSEFNKEHLLLSSTVSNGNNTLQCVEYEYNTNKLPTKVTTKTYNVAGSHVDSIELKEYDNKGNVTASWTPLANGNTTDTEHKTTYEYDSHYGILTKKTYKTNSATTVTVQNTLSSDYKGITTSLVKVNNNTKHKTEYTYDSYGNVIEEKRFYDGASALSNYYTVIYTYQNNAYVSSQQYSGVKANTGNALGTSGNLDGIITSVYSYDTLGRLISSADGSGNTTSYSYNALGDLTQSTAPDNTTISYTRNYTQNYVTVTDERGYQTRYSYTPLGQEYRTIIITPQGNHVASSKVYDAYGRLSTVYEYVNGSVTTYTYDALDRILSKTVKQGSTVLSKVTYAYDDAYNSQYRKVTRTEIGDADAPSVVTTQYTDAYGNIAKTGFFLGGTEYFNTNTYDYVGNKLTELTAADAERNLVFTAKYEYNENNQITKSYNAANKYITNTYDKLGNLISTTDYANTPTTYTYDALGRLLSQTITIATGTTAVSKYDYDAGGNIIREFTPVNTVGDSAAWAKKEYTYDSRNRLTSVCQYNGNSVASQTSYTYDSSGNMLTMTVGGNTTAYTYDRFGNVLSMTDALGHAETYTYSTLGRLSGKTDRNGVSTAYSYDALGRTVSTVAGIGDASEYTNFTYTKTGQIKEEETGVHKTVYAYDDLGRTTSISEIFKLDLLQHIVTLDANGGDLGSNDSIAVVNENTPYTPPIPTRSGYTFVGWYAGNTLYESGQSITIHEDTTLVAHWAQNFTVILDVNGGDLGSNSSTVIVADGDSYILPTPAKSGHTFGGWYVGTTRYDAGQSVVIHSNITFVAHWDVIMHTVTLDADGGDLGSNSSTVYVAENDTYTLPTPTKTGFAFDGWYVGTTRYEGGQTVVIQSDITFVAHWVNQYTVTLDANGGSIDTDSTVVVNANSVFVLPTPTRDHYVFMGWYINRTRYLDGQGVTIQRNVTFVAHWELPENLTSYTIVFNQGSSHVNNPPTYTQTCYIGAPVTLEPNTFAKGEHSFVCWSANISFFTTEYYSDCQNCLIDLTSVANGTVTLTALWDDDDLPFSNPPGDGPVLRSGSPTVSDNADFKSYTKSYTYDLAGNRTGFTLTAGETTVQDVAYTYDNLNRLSTVQQGGVTEATYTYDDNGNRKTLTYANGIVATYTYNKANWVTKITNKKGTTTRSSFDYTYYASGNQKTKTDKSGVVTSYLYDDLGRLTQESETNGVTLAYTYDSSGNRTGLTATGTESYSIAYTYDSDNRLLTEVKTAGGVAEDSAVYTYDDNGNMLSRVGTASGATVYTYNKLGQQVQAIVNGTKATYTYDTHGIRTSKRVGNTITTFLLDGADVVAEAQNNAVFANYLWGVNPIRADRTNSIRYFLYNAHGDVVQLTNASGSVTKNYSYDAFGNERNYDPAGINPFRYCGEYWDNETKTYYLRARYYNPAIGRFTQMDTHWNVSNMIYGDNPQKINERQDALGLKTYTSVPEIAAVIQAGNLYVYAVNSPTSFHDPDGEFVNMVAGLIVGGVLGGIEAAAEGNNIWQGAAIGAVSGFASGAVIDFTVASGGVGMIFVAVVASAFVSIGESIAQQTILDKKSLGELDYSQIAVAAVVGGVTGAVSYGVAGGSAEKVGGNILQNMKKNAIDTMMEGTTKTVSKSAVNKGTKVVSTAKTAGKVVVRKSSGTVRRRVARNAAKQLAYATAIMGPGKLC